MSGPPVYPFMKKVNFIPFKYTNSVSALETITVPATGTNDFIIDWGDGSATDHITTSSPSHEYVDADDYQISIFGTMPSFSFQSVTTSRGNVISFDALGNTKLTNVAGFARLCSNLITINTEGWVTTGITDFGSFASLCSSLANFDPSNIDMSNVTNLAAFVNLCPSLPNIDVSSWDVSNVINFSFFANGCTSFTALDVSSWDVSSGQSFSFFAQNCASITILNTNSWDTRLVTDCPSAFRGCTSLTSAFDEFRWWNRTDDLTPGGAPDPIATFTDCFKDSFNISNYASIPNNWKGL